MSILAGSLAGVCSTLLVYPLDVIRTRQQASIASASAVPLTARQALRAVLAAPLHPPATPPLLPPSGSPNFRALYAGLSLPLAAQALYKSTIFTSYTLLSDALPALGVPASLTPAAAGVVAGGINAAFFCTPVEFVRTNIIVNPHVDIFSRDTLRKMYKGSGVTILRDSLGCGSFFVFLTASQGFMRETVNGGAGLSLPQAALSGSFAGMGFWLLALPFDTLRTLSQSSDSWLWAGRIKADPALLFRGWQMAVCRGLPGAGTTVLTFEYAKRWLERGGGRGGRISDRACLSTT